MEKIARYLGINESAERLRELAGELAVTEFAQVRNLDYVFSPHELYPLAPHVRPPLPRIVAFALDMDGTSTTTEPLALHALEYMVRRLTGRLEASQWPGLDEQYDYPYVIGNSNFRHTEFLVQRYRPYVDHAAFTQAFFEALCWTLACMPDAQRHRDVIGSARNCGLADLLADPGFQRLTQSKTVDADNVGRLVEPFVQRFGPAFRPAHETALVAAALDIYYLRYHSILRRLERGEGERLAHELLGERGRRLIDPMPGYDVFVPLVKGWLGPETDALYESLRDHLLHEPQFGHTAAELDAYRPRLARLAEHFCKHPAKLALVTASSAYEAHICIQEVLRGLVQRVQQWPVPPERREQLAERLADYRTVFDAFVNASDACEPRLKPHRDLYSLALFQMSIPKQDYPCCVGLEDSEPGVIALRAAGIGCAVALPNRDTQAQDYAAATDVVRGGLPELILVRNLLLGQ